MAIRLCGKRRCCPTAEITEEYIIIKDDFGGEVKLTKENLEILMLKVLGGTDELED